MGRNRGAYHQILCIRESHSSSGLDFDRPPRTLRCVALRPDKTEDGALWSGSLVLALALAHLRLSRGGLAHVMMEAHCTVAALRL